MALHPKDFPLWEGHGLPVPSGVEVRKGKAVGREVIVFYRPSERSWAAVVEENFKVGDLEKHLGRMTPADLLG